MINLNNEEEEFLNEIGITKKEDLRQNENEILSYIMSKSTKNGDMQKAFNLYDSIKKKTAL